jgi:hypothetical protein
MAINAVVVNDFANRTLFARLPDTLTGPGRIAWADGWQALQLAEERGWDSRTPSLWASTKTAERVARVTAGEGQQLKVFFQSGNAAYSQLIGKPGLYAIVTADRAARYFLRVLFLHRPRVCADADPASTGGGCLPPDAVYAVVGDLNTAPSAACTAV